MQKRIFYTFFIFILSFSLSAQKKLNKDEIYSISCYEQNREVISKYFDSTVVAFVDSLKFSLVDTIGVFSTAGHGCFLYGTTENTKKYSPWTAHVFWLRSGEVFYQKLEKYSRGLLKKVSSSVLIDFYIDNKCILDEERIMPVCTDMSIQENRLVSTVSTTTSYTLFNIYCEMHGHAKLCNFESYYLEEKKSLFYEDNINSSINKWKTLIENEIRKLDPEY